MYSQTGHWAEYPPLADDRALEAVECPIANPDSERPGRGFCARDAEEVLSLFLSVVPPSEPRLAEQARNRDHHSRDPYGQTRKQQKIAQERRHIAPPLRPPPLYRAILTFQGFGLRSMPDSRNITNCITPASRTRSRPGTLTSPMPNGFRAGQVPGLDFGSHLCHRCYTAVTPCIEDSQRDSDRPPPPPPGRGGSTGPSRQNKKEKTKRSCEIFFLFCRAAIGCRRAAYRFWLEDTAR